MIQLARYFAAVLAIAGCGGAEVAVVEAPPEVPVLVAAPVLDRRGLPSSVVELIEQAEAKAPLVAEHFQQLLHRQLLRASREGGHVVTGRVSVHGTADLREVRSWMEVLRHGYFAGVVRDGSVPIPFLLDGHRRALVTLGPLDAPLTNLGEIELVPLSESEAATIRGRVVPLGDMPRYSRIVIEPELDNQPNTVSGRSDRYLYRRPSPRYADTTAHGDFVVDRLAAGSYRFTIAAPGHRTMSRSIRVQHGQTIKLGTVELEALAPQVSGRARGAASLD